MNFFEHQDWARRRTGLLVFLFALAVILVVAVTNVAVFIVLQVSGGGEMVASGNHWPFFAVVGILVIGLIVGASGFKSASLSKGGGTVAEMLGGRLLNYPSEQPDEHRLLNVVEEMAVASGTPVPLVYVLDDEPGINAFAAGHGPEDAAIAVTRGALEQFTRDELQGVIAHEFSHILNRDVRLNTRLTGLLFGILVLSIAGRLLLRGGAYSRIGRSDRGGAGAAVAIGLVLIIVGYVGVFFGRLIKQAVSRQREFLADASAVQFTRNPEGLANALKRIGRWTDGSTVQAPAAEEISHFFFADGMKSVAFARMLSSHPPLDERIRRLDPSFDGRPADSGVAIPVDALTDHAGLHADTPPASRPGLPGTRPALDAANAVDGEPASIVGAVGRTEPDRFVYDDFMDLEVSDAVRHRLQDPFGAEAVVLALLLDDDERRRGEQIDSLRGRVEPNLLKEVVDVYPLAATIDRFARLPAVDFAMPSLRRMSKDQFVGFRIAMDTLIDADDHLSLHEYAIRSIVAFRLGRDLGIGERDHRRPSTTSVSGDVTVLLSGLARIGHETQQEVNAAYSLARRKLASDMAIPAEPVLPGAGAIDEAIHRLSRLPARKKRDIVDACAYSVLADEDVRLEEAELLRIVITALGCPLPPFLPRIPAATS